MSEKKYDPTTIIVVTICVVLLLSWNFIFGPKGLDWLPNPTVSAESKTQINPETNTQQQKFEPSVANHQANIQPEILLAKTDTNNNIKNWIKEYPEIVLSEKASPIELTINPALGSISSITLKNYLNSTQTQKVVLNKDIIPQALTITVPKNDWKLIKILPPQIDQDKKRVGIKRIFKNGNDQSFLIKQDWILGNSYSIDYSVSLVNISNRLLSIPELYFWIGGIPPVQYLSGDIARSEAHRIDALTSENNTLISVKADNSIFDKEPIQFEPIKWLAISDKYFACIFRPADQNAVINGGNIIKRYQSSITEKDGKITKYYIILAAAREASININPEKSQTWHFKYYVGPKEINFLRSFAPKTLDILHLASSFLETISEWLLISLIFLKKITGSFGWAIIALTVIVKLIFWPITHKSNQSMKKLQQIQPMIKALKEKYKDDKQKLNMKTMELYKEQKVNPLGGCLPIVIQIPVFFALYWTLDGAIELRHTSFLWATDLTQPDTIGHILGIPINPLAIAMALTMFIQQKMTPMVTTDPVQAKMMLFMPLVMLVFLYSLPSGLTLYWTISQVISIVQLFYNLHIEKKQKTQTA